MPFLLSSAAHSQATSATTARLNGNDELAVRTQSSRGSAPAPEMTTSITATKATHLFPTPLHHSHATYLTATLVLSSVIDRIATLLIPIQVDPQAVRGMSIENRRVSSCMASILS